MRKHLSFRLFLSILSVCVLWFLEGCSSHVNYPALYHHDIAYQPKPLSSDSLKKAVYVSDVFFDKANADFDDELSGVAINVSRAQTFSFLNLWRIL